MKFSQNHMEVLLLRNPSYCRENVHSKGNKGIEVA